MPEEIFSPDGPAGDEIPENYPCLLIGGYQLVCYQVKRFLRIVLDLIFVVTTAMLCKYMSQTEVVSDAHLECYSWLTLSHKSAVPSPSLISSAVLT